MLKSAHFQSLLSYPREPLICNKLSRHDGTNLDKSIYIAVRDLVYDVTEGRKFCGKEGMYGFMAGKDATVCLAKFSLNPKCAGKIIHEAKRLYRARVASRFLVMSVQLIREKVSLCGSFGTFLS